MPKAAVFLLVEDSADDIFFFKRALAKCRVINPLQVARNGGDAIAYLKGSGPYGNRDEFPLPKVVFLDLKMPGVNGFDVLRWLREQPSLKMIRVIVLTGSEASADIDMARELGASTFLLKPVLFADLDRLARAVEGHWVWVDRPLMASEATVPH